VIDVTRSYGFDQLVEHLRAFTEVDTLVVPVAGHPEVFHADIHRPGMALMGYTEGFHPERIQVVGETELGYLATLDTDGEREALRRVFNLGLAGIFIAKDLTPSPTFLEEARATGVPIARAALVTDELISRLRDVFTELFAATTNMHATLVDVYGVGLLVTGRSGIGKSETALDLVERGHRLVADDIVVIKRRADDVLMGRSRSNVEHLMEIRGLGVIDVFPLFGVRAIRMQKRIEVELRLEEWDEGKEYDRHGLDRETTEILGVKIPKVTVPIFPGKNNTVIAEIIALDFMLKTYGIDSADEFNRKLIKTMSDSGSTNLYLLHDPE
jgi:HPr kinase/phosphorylase